MTDSKSWQKPLTSAGRLRLSRTPMLVKRRLLNSCFYLGASSAKLGLLKDAAAAILPSLTGWKLKKAWDFRYQFCNAV